jgi:hypothetical protein
MRLSVFRVILLAFMEPCSEMALGGCDEPGCLESLGVIIAAILAHANLKCPGNGYSGG